METLVIGLLGVIVILLFLNLFRTRAVPKVVQQDKAPIVVVDRPYYYNYPLYSYGWAPWWGWNGRFWPYSYGSGGYSGGIWTGGGRGGGGHHGGGGGGHGGGGHGGGH